MKSTEKDWVQQTILPPLHVFVGNFGGQILDFGIRVLETDADA